MKEKPTNANDEQSLSEMIINFLDKSIVPRKIKNKRIKIHKEHKIDDDEKSESIRTVSGGGGPGTGKKR